MLNRNQRITLFVGLVLALVASLFPPWRFIGWGMNAPELAVSFDSPAGRALLWTGPRPRRDTSVGRRWAKVDAGRLLAEIVIIAGATGLAVYVLGLPFIRSRQEERRRYEQTLSDLKKTDEPRFESLENEQTTNRG